MDDVDDDDDDNEDDADDVGDDDDLTNIYLISKQVLQQIGDDRLATWGY